MASRAGPSKTFNPELQVLSGFFVSFPLLQLTVLLRFKPALYSVQAAGASWRGYGRKWRERGTGAADGVGCDGRGLGKEKRHFSTYFSETAFFLGKYGGGCRNMKENGKAKICR